LVQRYVTRDSDSTFKVKRSKVKVSRPLYSPPCWRIRQLQRWRENVLAVRNCCYFAVCSAARCASAPTGEERGGAYRGGRPPTACFIRITTFCRQWTYSATWSRRPYGSVEIIWKLEWHSVERIPLPRPLMSGNCVNQTPGNMRSTGMSE